MALIQQLVVSNYRSLGENVKIRFGQLTALVGPNGSGKSNVLDTLGFVSDSVKIGLSGAITHRNGISAVRRWSSGRPYNVSIDLDLFLHGHPVRYGFELTGDKREEYRVKAEWARVMADGARAEFRIENSQWQVAPPEGLKPKLDERGLAIQAIGGDLRFKPLLDFLQNLAVYSVYPDTLRVPQKYSAVKPMARYGENWVSILKDQPEDSWKPDLVAALGKLTGDVEDVKVTKAASYLVVQFKHGSNARGKWFDAAQESDGTLRVAGIITALLQDPPLPLIAIEEPELTVHPGALPLLLDFLREASRRSQVIISTHSPELLDLMDADEVRVVERIDGATRVSRMAATQADAVKQGLMRLGELLVAEGLQGELEFSPE
jgi:predicted ATPase